ncbi:MAG: phosphate ABC transporter permease subunit PstC [Actinomycetota bacterium]
MTPTARSTPSITTRAVAGVLEPLIFIFVALLVALLEYFTGGPLGDFGPSNFWLAFLVLAVWNAWTFPQSQTTLGALTGQFIATADGSAATPLVIAVRQLTRFGILYGIPVLAIDFDLRIGLAVWLVAGALVWKTPDHRAPWDLVADTVVVTGIGQSGSLELPALRSAADLQLDPKRASQDSMAGRIMFLAGLVSVLISALIVYNIFIEAWAFVADEEFSWSLLKDRGWFPRRGEFDIGTLLVGTLWVTGIAMIVAVPVGLGVAFYLSEYAPGRVRRIVKPLIETLASIPSVVLGFFAISFITPNVLSQFFETVRFQSILAAGVGVGILTVPIVASISEDAMRAVPNELREASYGLGGRKVTTALRVVFPAALSGISAAIIVAISRAVGETMVVFIAAGLTGIFNTNPLDPGQTITGAMASLGAGTDEVAGVGIAFQSLYFLGAVLFILTLVLNMISDFVVRRFRQVY